MPPDNTAVALEAVRKPMEPGPFEYTFLAIFIGVLLALGVWFVLFQRHRSRIRAQSGTGAALNPGEKPGTEWGEALPQHHLQIPHTPSGSDRR